MTMSSSMAEEEERLVSEPLLPAQTASDDISTFGLVAAVFWILWIAALSIWAEVETSSSSSIFAVTIINDAKHTSAGHRFDLSYVSTDEITRILLNASAFAHHLLYQPQQPKKHIIRHLTVRLSAAKFNTNLETRQLESADGRFWITLSASVMENSDVDYALKSALLRAMARVWLSAAQSTPPPWLLDGMEEYVTDSVGFGNGKDCDDGIHRNTKFPGDKRPCAVAQYLGYCENRDKGYIRRLNQVLRDRSVDPIPRVGHICSIDHIIN